MLQQTQVVRVLDRFEPFMDRFPDPRALAEAGEQDVLAKWQGLGYYRRARSLHKAAKEIMEKHRGEVPMSVASLRSLPGVGRYTAGSIASIVGGQREPIVDGNVVRILARLYCDDAAVEDRAFVKRMWNRAEVLVGCCESPALLNEGMMELGAILCTPATPSCAECPLLRRCSARSEGRVHEIPRPKQRPKNGVIHHHAVVIRRRGRLLVERRPADGLWGGLWQAPAIEGRVRMKVDAIVERLEFPLTRVVMVASLTRELTHRLVHLHVHAGELKKGARVPAGDTVRWVNQTGLGEMALSSAARAVLAVLEDQ